MTTETPGAQQLALRALGRARAESVALRRGRRIALVVEGRTPLLGMRGMDLTHTFQIERDDDASLRARLADVQPGLLRVGARDDGVEMRSALFAPRA